MGGEAIVAFVVDEQGNVSDVKPFPFKDQRTERTVDIGGEKVTLHRDQRFDQASAVAVRQWTFSPGIKGGKPVKVRMSVPIVFTITEDKPGK